jgi:O-antigen ligase
LFGALFTVSQEVKDAHDVQKLFGTYWAACGIVLILLALSLVVLPRDVTWVAPDQWAHDSVLRFAGILGSPNQVGEIVVPSVASGILFWPAATKRVRIAIAVSVVAAIYFAAIADSRSSLLAVMVGLFAFTVDRYRRRALVVWAVLLLLGIVTLSILDRDTLEYVNRGDATTLTGRTEIWRFTIDKIAQEPLLGYGYEVEGQIFQDRHFPLWEEMWNQGPHIAVHSGYLARAVGMGVPALLLWLFLTLRPLIAVFRGAPDGFKIRDAIALGALPVLILNIDESAASDCRYSVGLLLAIIWCIAERSRLMSKQRSDSPEESARVILLASADLK